MAERVLSALLVGRGVTRRPWFEDLDLEVNAGEVVALRAPSGTGKTLLLRALADLDPRDAGTLSLRGRDSASMTPSDWRRAVIYLHQSPVPLPGDAAENVRALGVESVEAVLEAAGVAPTTPAADLSGGELQRLALFRALALRPSVLLLDEATSALDPDRATVAEDAVRAFVAGGAGGGALWVSHDAALLERVGDRALRLPEPVA